MYKLSNRSRKNMIGLHPILGFAVEMAIQRTEQDFGILDKGGVRTDVEQAAMYAQGRTTEGRKITWTLDSYHQYGLAVDLVAYIDDKFSWKVKHYTKITEVMKEVIRKYSLPIEHGLDLWGKDYPHWQLSGFKPYFDIRKFQ